MEFSIKLKKLLKEKNMSQLQLSEKSGIRTSSISDYITGKYKPKYDKILLIADALDISPLELMEEEQKSLYWKQYDKEHQEEIKQINEELNYINNSSDLVKRINILLAIRGKSIKELEEEAGFKEGTILQWNKKQPIITKIQKVSEILNTSVDYLMTGKDDNQDKMLFVARSALDLDPENLDLIKLTIKKLLKDQNK